MEVKIIINTNGTDSGSKGSDTDVVSVSRTGEAASESGTASTAPSMAGVSTMGAINAGPAPAAFAAPGAADGPRRFVGTTESSTPTPVGHGSDLSAGAAPTL